MKILTTFIKQCSIVCLSWEVKFKKKLINFHRLDHDVFQDLLKFNNFHKTFLGSYVTNFLSLNFFEITFSTSYQTTCVHTFHKMMKRG